MKISRSNLALAALVFVFFVFLSFFRLAPQLVSPLIASCQSFLFSCRNALFSFLSTPVFYLWLPAALFFLSLALALARLVLSFYFLSSLKKTEKLPAKLFKKTERLTELKKIEVIAVDSPEPLALAFGFKKPQIYLSESLVNHLKAPELEAVLLHEAAHIEKKHHLKLFLANFLRDFLFFLPLAHQLYSSFVLQKEIEADEEAIKKVGSSFPLASALLKTARLNRALAYSFPLYHSFTSLSYRIKHLQGEKAIASNKIFLKRLVASFLSLIFLFTSLGFVFPASRSCSLSCSSAICCQEK